MEKSDKIFLWVIGLSVAGVIGATAYNFLFAQNYDFYIEASCDPTTQTCFERDCSEVDACPPNNLSTYRAFYIKAADFKKCADNSCLMECTNSTIPCEELMCGESPEDICSDGEGEVTTEVAPTETVDEGTVSTEGEM